MQRYFDDFQIGEKFTSRGVTFTESDIIDFGLKYDPQPFHIDIEAATQTVYGGLIASGFQTLSLALRMILQKGITDVCSMGSPGMDEVRWLAPVRPGDTLHVEAEVIDKKPSRSKSDRGIMRMKYVAFNQREEPVLSFYIIHLLRRNIDVT